MSHRLPEEVEPFFLVIIVLIPWILIYTHLSNRKKRRELALQGHEPQFYLPAIQLNRFPIESYKNMDDQSEGFRPNEDVNIVDDRPFDESDDDTAMNRDDALLLEDLRWAFTIGQFYARLTHIIDENSGRRLTNFAIDIPMVDSPTFTIDIPASAIQNVLSARNVEQLKKVLGKDDGWRMSEGLDEQFCKENTFFHFKKLIRQIKDGDCKIQCSDGKFAVISHNKMNSQLAIHEFRSHAVELFRAYAKHSQLTATSWEDKQVRFDWWDTPQLIDEQK